MAEIDQNPTEVEQTHEQEYQPENEQNNELEYQPDNEHEYQPANEHENEHTVELDFANVHEEEKHEPVDELTENSLPGEKQDLASETVNEDIDEGGERWPGWPGESVFRMLVPAQKVGSIIGRKGEYIKKACEETKSRIKILDGPPGTRERAVMVSAKEEPNAPLPPAVDGLLRVHKRVVDGLENDASHPPSGGKVSTKLLVPAAQAGSLIGKQGTTVKSIQEESGCVVRVLGTEELPVFALQDDRIVEIVGEAAGIHKALELIANHLRKFLVDRSIIPVIEMQMKMPNSHPEQHMPPPQPWCPPQSFPPNAPSGPGYGASPHFMPPPRQFDNYYPPVDMPPPEKQSHQAISAYGREAPMRSSSSQPAPSVITQITHQMQIPLSYADAVIGTQGANISYIRRVSGATVTIQEARGVPGEMTVEISGTASQAQTAQQLIQESNNGEIKKRGGGEKSNPLKGKYRGVRQRKLGKWVAEIRDPIQHKRVWLGTYNTAEEASRAYEMKRLEFEGLSDRISIPLKNDEKSSSENSSNFMAEAAAGQQQQQQQAQQHAPPADYSSYAAHGTAFQAHSSAYASQPSNPSLGGQTGGYGSVYGSNYGY